MGRYRLGVQITINNMALPPILKMSLDPRKQTPVQNISQLFLTQSSRRKALFLLKKPCNR